MARTPRSEGGRARLFVALDLPAGARDSIAAWRDSFTAGREEELRSVVPEQLHVTLAFLGWQHESAADQIALATFSAAAGCEPLRLRAAALRAVPPRQPRLVALDLEDEGDRAAELQAAVAAALEALGAYEPEKRPFWPHITLARVRRGTRFTLTTEEVANVIGVVPSVPFEASTLTLYRSTLLPQGALYEPLGRMTLGGGAL